MQRANVSETRIFYRGDIPDKPCTYRAYYPSTGIACGKILCEACHGHRTSMPSKKYYSRSNRERKPRDRKEALRKRRLRKKEQEFSLRENSFRRTFRYHPKYLRRLGEKLRQCAKPKRSILYDQQVEVQHGHDRYIHIPIVKHGDTPLKIAAGYVRSAVLCNIPTSRKHFAPYEKAPPGLTLTQHLIQSRCHVCHEPYRSVSDAIIAFTPLPRVIGHVIADYIRDGSDKTRANLPDQYPSRKINIYDIDMALGVVVFHYQMGTEKRKTQCCAMCYDCFNTTRNKSLALRIDTTHCACRRMCMDLFRVGRTPLTVGRYPS